MELGAFLFGGVEMNDASAGAPAPTDRRYSNKEVWEATMSMLDTGVAAEKYGYDSFWLTEHHFQYEGYEVIPNAMMFGAILAERTKKIKIGALFNIVPQWHPIRLAEDFAILHNLSEGRGVLGVGRGTVPREAEPLGTQIGSFDNPDKAAADTLNREIFDESMQVILMALENETFSFKGKHFEFPPPGIPDRGGTVQELTLVPRPLYPYDVWQAITSPPTLDYVPQKGWGGVFWNQNHLVTKKWWEKFADNYESHNKKTLEAGEKRMLCICVRVEDTFEKAMSSARDGHDEFWKFLGPYGWGRGYLQKNGEPVEPGNIPTLEDSVEQKVWAVGSPEGVAETISNYCEMLGGVEHLSIFPHLPGDTYAKADEQLQRFSEEVRPLL